MSAPRHRADTLCCLTVRACSPEILRSDCVTQRHSIAFDGWSADCKADAFVERWGLQVGPGSFLPNRPRRSPAGWRISCREAPQQISESLAVGSARVTPFDALIAGPRVLAREQANLLLSSFEVNAQGPHAETTWVQEVLLDLPMLPWEWLQGIGVCGRDAWPGSFDFACLRHIERTLD